MPPEKFFPKARSGGERRQNARNGDFPEAALDAAWVIGQWASRSPLTSPPPRWAFDVCAEFYLALSIVPNLLDREGVRGPKPRRDDLQKLIKISRVLAGYPDPGRPKGGQSISATGKPRSITKIIEDLYPRRMEREAAAEQRKAFVRALSKPCCSAGWGSREPYFGPAEPNGGFQSGPLSHGTAG